MGTIAEKLVYTKDSVNDIQKAIVEKGVAVGDGVALGEYGTKIREIASGAPTVEYAVVEAIYPGTTGNTMASIDVLPNGIEVSLAYVDAKWFLTYDGDRLQYPNRPHYIVDGNDVYVMYLTYGNYIELLHRNGGLKRYCRVSEVGIINVTKGNIRIGLDGNIYIGTTKGLFKVNRFSFTSTQVPSTERHNLDVVLPRKNIYDAVGVNGLFLEQFRSDDSKSFVYALYDQPIGSPEHVYPIDIQHTFSIGSYDVFITNNELWGFGTDGQLVKIPTPPIKLDRTTSIFVVGNTLVYYNSVESPEYLSFAYTLYQIKKDSYGNPRQGPNIDPFTNNPYFESFCIIRNGVRVRNVQPMKYVHSELNDKLSNIGKYGYDKVFYYVWNSANANMHVCGLNGSVVTQSYVGTGISEIPTIVHNRTNFFIRFNASNIDVYITDTDAISDIIPHGGGNATSHAPIVHLTAYSNIRRNDKYVIDTHVYSVVCNVIKYDSQTTCDLHILVYNNKDHIRPINPIYLTVSKAVTFKEVVHFPHTRKIAIVFTDANSVDYIILYDCRTHEYLAFEGSVYSEFDKGVIIHVNGVGVRTVVPPHTCTAIALEDNLQPDIARNIIPIYEDGTYIACFMQNAYDEWYYSDASGMQSQGLLSTISAENIIEYANIIIFKWDDGTVSIYPKYSGDHTYILEPIPDMIGDVKVIETTSFVFVASTTKIWKFIKHRDYLQTVSVTDFPTVNTVVVGDRILSSIGNAMRLSQHPVFNTTTFERDVNQMIYYGYSAIMKNSEGKVVICTPDLKYTKTLSIDYDNVDWVYYDTVNDRYTFDLKGVNMVVYAYNKSLVRTEPFRIV